MSSAPLNTTHRIWFQDVLSRVFKAIFCFVWCSYVFIIIPLKQKINRAFYKLRRFCYSYKYS